MKVEESGAPAIGRMLIRLLLLLLPFAFAAAGLNQAYYDSSNMYGHTSRYELELARRLVEGKIIAFENDQAQDYDWRLLRKDYAQLSRERAKPNVLALGSSHTTDLSSRSFYGRSFANAAFPSATYEEMEAIYGIYRKQGLIPARVIIPLEIYLLDPHSRSAGVAESIRADYAEIADSMGVARGSTLLDPFNLIHFQSSFGVASGLLKLDDAPYFYHVTDTPDSAPAGMMPDGSLFIRAEAPATQSRKVAETVEAKKVEWFRGFTNLDRAEEQNLERFLSLLARDHVDVLLYLPPAHPLFYSTFHTSAYPVVDAAQQYYEGLAARYGLSLLGSYNPADCGLEGRDFEDGDHLTDEGLARVFLLRNCYRAR